MAEDDDDSARPPTSRGGGRRRFLLITAAVLAFFLLAGGTLAWLAYRKLDGNIGTDATTGRLLEHDASERPDRGPLQAENILLIGSDDRSGANAAYGYAGGRRSDTTILLHLSADRRHATAVSIPRDAMVRVPACELPDGTRTQARFMQFNWAFEAGGPACTIRTVERLSGIRVDHHLILDFTGFKQMVDAVGGVEVCVPRAIHDKDAQLDLPAGRQTLGGEQALGFVRVRETLGDGSDTQRMGRQQQFLASLIRKVQSQGVLLNPTRLWPLLDAATSAITADEGLSRVGELYDLAQDLRSMPTENVVFLTTPRRPYPGNWDRDQLVQPQTDQLFAALRADLPVAVQPYQVTPSPSPSPSRTPSPSPSAWASTYAGPFAPAYTPWPSAAAAEDATVETPTPDASSASAAPLPTTSPTLEGRTADQDSCAMH
ncbi:LCP family protein required for cell wall assembly [Kitasatospora gansuensis]|uniref:LCP family protein required for cell wall assembly n=1 Tax=Kitasatospora gansuensis TaxID=258050 RepID=A0A7W7WIM5_9ACTN|nr:LCP family protein [Kitasatospora gansuensis]MBB4948942.1 LCP family protein required for cell wall assembly [Kitasatospora gansuensis]